VRTDHGLLGQVQDHHQIVTSPSLQGHTEGTSEPCYPVGSSPARNGLPRLKGLQNRSIFPQGNGLSTDSLARKELRREEAAVQPGHLGHRRHVSDVRGRGYGLDQVLRDLGHKRRHTCRRSRALRPEVVSVSPAGDDSRSILSGGGTPLCVQRYTATVRRRRSGR
jgi:hypothetical protein